MADHKWQDDAYRPGGRAWVAGQVFVCACGVERRMIYTDDELKDRRSIYFVGGKRVKGGEPRCTN